MPESATVKLDSGIAGSTPYILTLPAGQSHQVSVVTEGYRRYTQPVTVQPGERIEISVVLAPVEVQTPDTGAVQVVSIPSGALVTLDEINAGTTPTTLADVPAWEHVIDVAMAGYQAWVKKVNVKGGKVLYIDATLIKSPPETGILSISSNPAGADVYTNAVHRGFTPKSTGNIVPGLHRVKLVLAGEQEWVSEVMVFPGEVTVLSPVLTPNANPLTGAIHIDSRPIGAAIYLDGNFIGITCSGNGFDIINVIPGSHQITLRMKGFSDYTTSINVPADRMVKIIPAMILSQIPHPSGKVQFDSVPEGAGVYLDGKFTGYTPLTVHDIAVGQHDVRMKMEGWEEHHDIIRG